METMSQLDEVSRRTVTQGSQLGDITRNGTSSEISSAVLPKVKETSMNKESSGRVDPKPIVETEHVRSVKMQPGATSRLVAWTDSNGLGAEKFRALAIRLDDMRRQHPLNTLQVTSTVINEGKTFVSANLAVTLAKYFGAKTLLVEGDLHRPTLASIFGLNESQGITDWWIGPDQEMTEHLVHFNDAPLWFLPAGRSYDQPSELLHSPRFAEAFVRLTSQFDWVVVDSTPMLPAVDANLWSRLVDGTLLVVREGIAPLKALKSGLQSLDRPKLIGVVVNEASEFDQADYAGQYTGIHKMRRAAG
jgi:capsular exopolysaccharide synthesis family protein